MTDSTAAVPTSAIVWFELPSGDTERTKSFYSSLFGWTFEPFGDLDYHSINEAGGAIFNDPSPDGTRVYFAVDEIDESARRVEQLGGKTCEKQEIPGYGFYVQCVDLDGNKFGLFQGLAS